MTRNKKQKKQGLSRRDLLRSAMEFGSFAALQQLMMLSAESQAATAGADERHLVTFQWRGGWDQIWGFQSLLSSEVTPGLATPILNSDVLGESGPRYLDSEALPFFRHYLGPAAIPLQSNFSNMAVWRGLQAPGSHFVGNFRMQHGHQSAYANTYQGIISNAYAAAPHSLKPFHYVQIGVGDPGSFYADIGQNIGGAAIPIDIPDQATWDKLSSKISGDPTTTAARRDIFLNGISNLSSRSYALPASQAMVGGFNSNISGAFNIIGQNFSTNPAYGFQQIYNNYLQAAVTGMTAAMGTQSIQAGLKYHSVILGNQSNSPNVVNDSNVKTNAWRFAVTQFLLAQNLSFAVDVALMSGDFHGGNYNDLYYQIINNSMLNEFMNFLKRTPSGSNGKSLFDTTLTVMFAEFIRHTAVGFYGYNSNHGAGTEHGASSLVFMAGGPTNPGLYGDIMTGPEGPMSAFSSAFKNFATPLPIDPQTGVASLTGQLYEQISMFTTICAMWGVAYPPQQVTPTSIVFPAIIKSGWA